MPEEAKKQTEEQKQPGLTDILKAYQGAPSQEQIEGWKKKHGSVYVFGFSEEELFVFRALRRAEWVQLQSMFADPENKMDQFKFEELVCDTCVLWKSIQESWTATKGGVVQGVNEAIMQNSNFLSPQAVSLLCAKL